MNKQELTKKYRQLRQESVVGSARNYSLNTVCVMLQNNTLEGAIKRIQKAVDYTENLEAYDVFVTFLLDARGEY